MKKTFTLLLSILSVWSYAQMPTYELPLYPKSIPNEGKAVAHRSFSESHVKYSKRVHRVIDGRMKRNKAISWPRNPLNKILWKAVTKGYPELGKPAAYANDSLKTILTEQQIREKGAVSYTFKIEKPPGSLNFEDTTVAEPLDPASINKFRIMEDWVFDAQHSTLKPRIIAIAPLYNMVSQSGVDLGEAELFWVKMEELRPILAQQEIFNRHNDAARMSYDHWFEMRHFASHIVKESNVYDLDIKYIEGFRDNGVEALLEADKIKNDLLIVEHDLWEY